MTEDNIVGEPDDSDAGGLEDGIFELIFGALNWGLMDRAVHFEGKKLVIGVEVHDPAFDDDLRAPGANRPVSGADVQ